jgi:segregation and condensation protein A
VAESQKQREPATGNRQQQTDAGTGNREANKGKPLASEYPFAVTVGDVYDGPLDLLLDLIRKQDIDIYDIPIAQITAQYLSYVEKMKQMDVNLAADFVYMASLLIQIKSRMLLPRDPSAPAGTEEDPRDELVNRLLEHERFKTAAQLLMQKQQIEEAVVSNPALKLFKNDEGTEAELATDVIDLVKTFRDLMERLKSRPVMEVQEENVSVGQMIQYVRRRLMLEERPIALKQMFRSLQTRQALVCAFLAVLELVRLQAVLLRQESTFGEVMIKKHKNFEAVMTEQAAVRDDWR